MKKITMRILALLIAVITVFGLASCGTTDVGGDKENTNLQRYFAPVVKVSKTGLATWTDLEGAEKFVYVINDGKETETTEKSVQLCL